MPVFDPGTIAGVIGNLLVSIGGYALLATILYNFGALFIRLVSWTLDLLIINFIDKFYTYFETILKGEILSQVAITGMRERIYLLIGALVLFKLGTLLIRYIINPSEVMDEKLGVNALVKRVILGMCMIIATPFVFSWINDFQAAILNDQIIERIIMDKDQLQTVTDLKKKYGTGKIIGVTVFQGFWSMNENQVTDAAAKKAYKDATENYDLSYVEESGVGILTKEGDNYVFDYFPIISTIVLGYVLYLMIKYCLDLVVRSFKLSILQVIAPITIVEYMINGDRNEVFKNWRKTVIANYMMLFLRIFTIWFVVYVAMLMQPSVTDAAAGSLLRDPDKLLKAIIIIGLLAFLMDFPKMISEIFGLDLEQDASVKGMMGKIGGIGKALGLGALAAGGAAAMGGFKKAQNSINTNRGLRNLEAQKKKDIAAGKFDAKAQQAYNNKKQALMSQYQQNKANIRKSTGSNMLKAAAQSTPVTNALYGGAMGVSDSIKGKEEKERQQQLEQEKRDFRTQQMAASTATVTHLEGVNNKLNDVVDNTEVTSTRTVNIDTKLGHISNDISDIASNTGNIAKNTETTATQTVNIDQKLGKVSGNIENIAQNTETTATQTVHMNQQLGTINSSDVDNSTKTSTVGGVYVSEPDSDGERITEAGIILPSSIDIDKAAGVETLIDKSTGEKTTKAGIILNGNLDDELRNRH